MFEVRLERGNASVSLHRRVAQALEDDDLKVGIQLRVEAAQAYRLVGLESLGIGDDIAGRIEVAVPGQHLVQDRAKAVEVGALVHVLAGLRLFWSHVFEGAHDMPAD